MSDLAYRELDTLFPDIASNQATGLAPDKKFFCGHGFLMENQPMGEENVSIVSDSAADTMNVTVYGVLKTAKTVVVSEVKALTGTTAVPMTSNTTWEYIIGIKVASSPAGNVSVKGTTTGKVIATVAASAAGANLYNVEEGIYGTLDSGATPAEVYPTTMIVGKKVTIFSADTTVVTGSITFDNDVTINGTLTFGDVNLDTFILKGRMATMSLAGAAIDINATYTYSEGIELRHKVTSWTGVGSSFTGEYFRTENQSASSSAKELHSIQVYGADYSAQIASGNGLSVFHGLLVDMLIKPGNATASNNITIGTLTAGEFCISPETAYGVETITITTRASCLQLAPSSNGRITGGNLAKIHGLYILARDGDGGSTALGSGIEMVSDPAQSGTRTFTTGIKMTIGAVTGISLAGAMTTGLSITGSSTTAVSILTGTYTTGISVAGTTTTGIAISATVTAGLTVGNSTTGINVSGACSATGVLVSGACTTAGIAVSGTSGIGFSVLTGTFTTGLSLAGVMSGSAISIAPPSGTTPLGITFASGTITTAILIASTTVTGISMTSAMTTGVSIDGNTTNSLSVTGAATGSGLLIAPATGDTVVTGITLGGGAGTLTTGINIGGCTVAITAVNPINVTMTQPLATPGTIRLLYGKQITFSTMSSGNLVGVRGEILIPDSAVISGTAFLYGVQGKFIMGTTGGTGSTSISVGSSHVCGVLGQLDISNGTTTAGHIACIIASVQDTSSTLRTQVQGIYVEAPTYGSGGGINSILQGNGGATTILEMAGVNSSFFLAVPATGQTCWSATNASTDAGKIAIKIGADTRYINCFVS